MDIGFTDAKIRRLFNDFGLLCDRYGVDLAEIIATRMGVLRGAKHLGLVPQRPPVSLRPVDGSPLAFTVDLAPPRKLAFGALWDSAFGTAAAAPVWSNFNVALRSSVTLGGNKS